MRAKEIFIGEIETKGDKISVRVNLDNHPSGDAVYIDSEMLNDLGSILYITDEQYGLSVSLLYEPDVKRLISILSESLKEIEKQRNEFFALLATKVVNTQAPLHYEAPKPALVVLPTAPETAPIPKTVQVNWSRGFSGAKYDVLGYGVSQMKDHENERYYLINNSTDENKPMIKRVWANDCQVGIEKVAIAQEKAAA